MAQKRYSIFFSFQKIYPSYQQKMGVSNCRSIWDRSSDTQQILFSKAEVSQSIPPPYANPLQKYINKQNNFQIKTLSDLMESSEREYRHRRQTGQALTQQRKQILQENKEEQLRKQGNNLIKHQINPSNLEQNSLFLQKLDEPSVQVRSFKKLQVKIEKFIKITEEPITNYYQFKQLVGEGAFGSVYRGINLKTQEERAIKVLKKKAMKSKETNEFLAEMELLGKLDHPNIIKLHQIFYYNNFYYVVTQFCRGGELMDIISKTKKKISEHIIANIMKQLFSSLAYLHSLNIVHRDIKLQNIVFLQKNNFDEQNYQNQTIPVKIIDFGTALQTKYKLSHGKLAGTLNYIAPEALKGKITEKSDLWSCGVLLSLLLTGKSPFKGVNAAQTRKNIETKVFTCSEYYWKNVSVEAKKLVESLLQRNHLKRISAIDALKSEWISNHSSRRTNINMSSICNLQKYHRQNNLISVIESFLSVKRISQEERQYFAQIFSEIDTDNNGVIQINELATLYHQIYGINREQQLQQMISMIDQNESGKIDFNEFMIAMYSRKKLFYRQSLEEAFEHFDVDKTGYLEKEQLKEIITGCDLEQIEYLLKELDTDNDQRISKAQFIDYLLKF